MIKIKNPILKYLGSKFIIADWIISYFPQHQTYVEVFGGSACVLLKKLPSHFEVYNDLNGDIVTFFRVLRNRPSELHDAVLNTPFSRAEYDAAFEMESIDDELEIARRVVILSWQQYGGYRGGPKSGWAVGEKRINDWRRFPSLITSTSWRLRHVALEKMNCIDAIGKYDSPDTLFYCDPPYVMSTRCKVRKYYRHEMADVDHTTLAKRLNAIKGYAILSGYDGSLYDSLYSDWRKAKKETYTQGRLKSQQSKSIESLWLSPNIPEIQLSLGLG